MKKTNEDLLSLLSSKGGGGSRYAQTSSVNSTKAADASLGDITVTARGKSPNPSLSSSVDLYSLLSREVRKDIGHNAGSSSAELTENDISQAVDRVSAMRGVSLSDLQRADLIVDLKGDLLGWGVLQPLVDNPDVTDIHCYDYQTVVLQKGKKSEITGLSWSTKEAYTNFIDRLLYRLGKSLSVQQHTVDCSFANGIRLCAVHESVCGARGPFLTMRIPRVYEASLESLIAYHVAPPLMVNYLAAITRSCEHTMIVAGETGTGKTTIMRCLGTQFQSDESIVGVEDTPELNYQHKFYRSLVSRTANTEGIGEVTLQGHVKTTLRMTPSRVILGEMRTPEAAEAFLEAAQTGHTGMATVHARNARETLTRLESLLGRAQRGVDTDVIRQQVALAVSVVVWMTREKASGRVRIGEIGEVGRLVEGVIQFRPMFKLVSEGERPKWEVQSWATYFGEVLDKYNVALRDAPQYITLGGTPTSG